MTERTIAGFTWRTDPLWTLFSETAQADPAAIAVIVDDTQVSRRELSDLAQAVAAFFSDNGIGPGDRVLVEGHASLGTIVSALALSKLGAIFCPFNARLGSGDRQILIERLEPAAVLSKAPGPDLVAVPGMDGQLHAQLRRPLAAGVAASAADQPEEEPTVLIGFTGGTTGLPKAVMYTSSAINYAGKYAATLAGLQPQDKIFSINVFGSGPAWTFNGNMALTLGHPLVLLGPWNPQRALELIERHQCAWSICVPTHLHGMVEVARSGQWSRPLTSMKALACGGGPLSAELISDAEKLLGIRTLRWYGLSECLGHNSTRLTDPPERRHRWDGVPFPGTHVEAYDDQGQVLPRGQVGEAGVRGPSSCKGYYPGLGSTESVHAPDGSYLTGDLIVRDEEGFVRVVGRKKDQIIRGGTNIDAAEIETALSLHPEVLEVVCIGTPDERLGEQLMAVITLRGATAPSLEQLTAFLDARGLAKFKWPEFLRIVDGFPRTASHKINKAKVRELIAGSTIATSEPALE